MRLARPVTDAPPGIAAVEVNVVSAGRVSRQTDLLSVEEPLEIRVSHGPADLRQNGPPIGRARQEATHQQHV